MYTGSYKFFSRHYGVKGRGGILNCIVTNLPPIKLNEINTFHSDKQNHASYTGSHKKFMIYYRLSLEKAGNLF